MDRQRRGEWAHARVGDGAEGVGVPHLHANGRGFKNALAKLERNHIELLLPLWLPILLSAAAVWIVSLVVWMAMPHHRQDFIGLPDEDGFMDYIRRTGIKPGNYLFPDFRGREALQSEKVQKALNEGPVGRLSVWPTPLTMGGKLVGAFIVYFVASTLIAYLTRVALPGAASFARVFQVAATAGVLALLLLLHPQRPLVGLLQAHHRRQLSGRHPLRRDHRRHLRLAVATLTLQLRRATDLGSAKSGYRRSCACAFERA